MRGSKIPVQELWLKMGGGRNSGILRYFMLKLLASSKIILDKILFNST